MKIITVIGARPQFIKASVVSKRIKESNQLTEILIHTGQHFDSNMSDVFFSELGMDSPDYHFDIHGGNHGEMTGKMLLAIEKVLIDELPDIVLVYGDTNSTLAGALAAAKLNIPVAHIEAGLRSFNTNMPEEINRILTDRISSWLFTPTNIASQNLEQEGVNTKKIIPVGDVMYDVAMDYGSKVNSYGGVLGQLASQGIQPKAYCLATIHRAENTDHSNPLDAITAALATFSQDMPVVWPLHPRTRKILEQANKLEILSRKIVFIEPVGYLDMVQLEKYSALIATDSGGVQKEAFFHRVPCVTLRDETEWIELVDNDWISLAPPNNETIILETLKSRVNTLGKSIELYGKGDASHKIVDHFIKLSTTSNTLSNQNEKNKC